MEKRTQFLGEKKLKLRLTMTKTPERFSLLQTFHVFMQCLSQFPKISKIRTETFKTNKFVVQWG